MPNNNFKTEVDRHKFLSSANGVELNDYFKKIESLARSKGGKFRRQYDDDMQYIINNTDSSFFQSANLAQIGGFFSGIYKKITPDPLARVSIMQVNAYCPIITQGTFMSDDCRVRSGEMDMIAYLVNKVHNGYPVPAIGLVVRRFVELIFCCSSVWYKNELRREEIKDVAIKIGNSPVLTKNAKNIIKPLLDVEPNQYIVEYIDLRKEMKEQTKTGPKYTQLKEKKNKLIDTYGAPVLYATKLIDYMIHQSIKDDDIV
jgi:hypothetical protein